MMKNSDAMRSIESVCKAGGKGVNMGEIKLRAWSNYDNKYAEMPIYDLKISESASLDADGYDMYDAFDIERYTGLKDNEREVYEGDIYKWCGLTFPITIDDYHGYRFMFGKDQLTRGFIENGEYRGNVHENPELLEAQNEHN